MVCQYPVTLAVDPPTEDVCGAPAAWHTDDLDTVHMLCEPHCREAMRWNGMSVDPVEG